MSPSRMSISYASTFEKFLAYTNKANPSPGWISAQVDDGRPLTDIVVQSFVSDGVMRKVLLTAEIWQRSLILGPWASRFLPLWNDYITIRNSR